SLPAAGDGRVSVVSAAPPGPGAGGGPGRQHPAHHHVHHHTDAAYLAALSRREMPYVDAARAAGFGPARIILRHMLPNVMAPYLIMVTAFLGQAILLEASLSFLGLGVPEPIASWGLMLRGAAVDFAESAPWMAVFPGLAISLAVFAFNLFGDSLRDALDPKLRTL